MSCRLKRPLWHTENQVILVPRKKGQWNPKETKKRALSPRILLGKYFPAYVTPSRYLRELIDLLETFWWTRNYQNKTDWHQLRCFLEQVQDPRIREFKKGIIWAEKQLTRLAPPFCFWGHRNHQTHGSIGFWVDQRKMDQTTGIVTIRPDEPWPSGADYVHIPDNPQGACLYRGDTRELLWCDD